MSINPKSWFSSATSSEQPAQKPSRGILSWLRQTLGGWAGPEHSQGSRAERDLRTERVRSGPLGVVLPWFLPYFDEQQTLSETPQMRLAYRRMLADPNVKAAFLGKALAVGALNLKINPARKKDKKDQRIADFVRWNLTEALADGVPGLIWSILSGALIDGYSVCEKVWAHEDRGDWRGKYYLRAAKPKDTGRDVVLETDEYRNIVGVRGLRYNPGITFPTEAFILYRHLPLWGVATGMSDFRAVYGRWWLLDTVLKLRAIGLEKRSLPVLVGTFLTPEQRPSLEASLALVKSQNWLAVPEGVRVEALNIAGSADGMFAEAIKDLKHDIFLGIQGAILQALEGSVTDGAGNSSVHRSTADLFNWQLSHSVEQVLNDRQSGLIRDVVDLNFVADRYPRATLSAVDTGELLAEADLDQKIWSMGLDLSKEEMYEKYGRTPPDPENPDDCLSNKDSQGGGSGGAGGAMGGLAGMMGGAGGGGEEEGGEDADAGDEGEMQGQDAPQEGQGDEGEQGEEQGGQQDEETGLEPLDFGDAFDFTDGGSGGADGSVSILTGKTARPQAFREGFESFANHDRRARKQGFTGKRTDKRGRERCYQAGHPVPCHPGATLAGSKGAKPARKTKHKSSVGADPAHPLKKAHQAKAVQQVLAQGASHADSGPSLESRLGEHAQGIPAEKMGRLKKAWRVAKAVEHKLMIGFHKAKELAVEVAKERGLSQEHAERAGKIVGVVDQILTWTTTFPVVTATTGSVALGKVASFIPVASLAYVAGSALANPFAAIRAARTVIRRTLGKEQGVAHAHGELRVSRDAVALLLQSLARVDGDEQWLALIHAALDETTGDLVRSIRLADQAYDQQQGASHE